MTRCPYKIDGLRCEKDFGHEEGHLHTIRRKDKDDLPIAWPYADYLREADVERGFVRCGSYHPGDADLTCSLPIGHEGQHEGTGWDDQALAATAIAWTDDWEPPAPEAVEEPKREVPEQVAAERVRRAGMPQYLISFQRKDSGIERQEVVGVEYEPGGALLIRTRDDDVLMPPGSWGPVRMEPTRW